MKDKLITYFTVLMVYVTVFTVAGIIYLAWFDVRQPPITVTYSHPVPVRAHVTDRSQIEDAPYVGAGGTILTYREFCVTSKYKPLLLHRWILSTLPGSEPLGFLPYKPQIPGKIECKKVAFSHVIPPWTPPGEYVFDMELTYELWGNPIVIHKFDWPSIKVTVVK